MFYLSADRVSILHVLLTDKVQAGFCRVGEVSLHHISHFDRSIFHHTTRCRRSFEPLQVTISAQDGEIGDADLVWVAIDDGWQTEVLGVNPISRDVEFVVATVVTFGPLKLTIVPDQGSADVVGGSDGDVLTERAGTADGSAGKFDSDSTNAGCRVVWTLIQPDKIGDPACELLAGVAEDVGDNGLLFM